MLANRPLVVHQFGVEGPFAQNLDGFRQHHVLLLQLSHPAKVNETVASHLVLQIGYLVLILLHNAAHLLVSPAHVEVRPCFDCVGLDSLNHHNGFLLDLHSFLTELQGVQCLLDVLLGWSGADDDGCSRVATETAFEDLGKSRVPIRHMALLQRKLVDHLSQVEKRLVD